MTRRSYKWGSWLLGVSVFMVCLSSLSQGAEIQAKYAIETPDGGNWGTVKVYDDGDIKIEVDGIVLKGKRSGDKRKYKTEEKEKRFEVKYDGMSFKLRTADSQLLWKVKKYDNKIKLSDNEENEHPFEVRWKDEKKAKLNYSNQFLAEVKFYKDKMKLKVKNAEKEELFVCKKHPFHPAYVVLAIDDIAAVQRAILLAELLVQ